MNFKITIEGRKDLTQIQREFKDQLSEKQILTSTAKAINTTSRRVQGFIRKGVLANYTVNRKYLNGAINIRRYAKGSVGGLYSEISFSYRPIPMVAFKHTGSKNKKGGVSVQIKKGNSTTFRHSFIATMKGNKGNVEHFEHEGIYAAGRYVKKTFAHDGSRTPSGKRIITELRSASPFTMATTKPMQVKIREYVVKDLQSGLRYLLNRKIERLTKGRR